jgi:hypothetical protein
MKSLEDEFHQAMLEIYKTAKSECSYRAIAFLDMLAEMGGVKTAKKLLSTTEMQSGLYELYDCGRLDLTVECLVAEKDGGKFRILFEEKEVAEAEHRLELLRSKQ